MQISIIIANKFDTKLCQIHTLKLNVILPICKSTLFYWFYCDKIENQKREKFISHFSKILILLKNINPVLTWKIFDSVYDKISSIEEISSLVAFPSWFLICRQFVIKRVHLDIFQDKLLRIQGFCPLKHHWSAAPGPPFVRRGDVDLQIGIQRGRS